MLQQWCLKSLGHWSLFWFMHNDFIRGELDQSWGEPCTLGSSAGNTDVVRRIKKLNSKHRGVNTECFSWDWWDQAVNQTQHKNTEGFSISGDDTEPFSSLRLRTDWELRLLIKVSRFLVVKMQTGRWVMPLRVCKKTSLAATYKSANRKPWKSKNQATDPFIPAFITHVNKPEPLKDKTLLVLIMLFLVN